MGCYYCYLRRFGGFMVVLWWFHGGFVVVSWWFCGGFVAVLWGAVGVRGVDLSCANFELIVQNA